MKKNHTKLIIVLLFMLVVESFNFFVLNIFSLTNIYYLLFLLLILITLIAFFGFPKDNKVHKVDVLQIVFIYSITFFIAIYILGFFFGFTKSPYNLSFLGILKNIDPTFIIIILEELIRFIFVSKSKEKKILIYIFITLIILLDLTVRLRYFEATSALDIYEMMSNIVLPCIGRNILLTYITYKAGYKAPILYRFIFEITVFILPVFPDLGIYIYSILDILLPVIIFLKLNSFFAKNKNIRTSKRKRIVFMLPGILALTVMVILISGMFKFYALAIGSNSMNPYISKGDVVIVKKVKKRFTEQLEVGNVIVYYNDERTIVHRLVEKVEKNNEYIYFTKGDNNSAVDNYYVSSSQIKGIVLFKIPYIGYPSVWLSELID